MNHLQFWGRTMMGLAGGGCITAACLFWITNMERWYFIVLSWAGIYLIGATVHFIGEAKDKNKSEAESESGPGES